MFFCFRGSTRKESGRIFVVVNFSDGSWPHGLLQIHRLIDISFQKNCMFRCRHASLLQIWGNDKISLQFSCDVTSLWRNETPSHTLFLAFYSLFIDSLVFVTWPIYWYLQMEGLHAKEKEIFFFFNHLLGLRSILLTTEGN